MLIKPAFLLIVSININTKGDSGRRIRIPLPVPLIILLSLAMSAEEFIDIALLFTWNKHRKRLKLLKASAISLRIIMMEMMFVMGPYDFVRVDAGEGEDWVRINIYTK